LNNEVYVLNPVGQWTLHFDWGLNGTYNWTSIYFNFDGTFAYLAGANDGSWVLCDDAIILRFKRTVDQADNTVYSGSATRNFMSGSMMSALGERGHWFAIKKGTKVYSQKDKIKLPYLVEKESKPKIDPAGTPQTGAANQ
jgi:hypothetical protein